MGRGNTKVLGFLSAFALLFGAGCSCGDDDPTPDAGTEIVLDHCEFTPVPGTAGAGGTVSTGAITVGTAERILDIPVGTALGAYTERAGFLGSSGTVDLRQEPLSGSFNASIGVETAPRVKVVAISAGGETVVLIKLDLGLAFEGMLFDIEARLGAGFAGKVLLAASHSHSAWGQNTGNSIYKVGLGELRETVYSRYLDQIEAAATSALGSMQPAKLGIFIDRNFDADNIVTRDRRGENDELMGGPRKDDTLALVRIDALDDTPLAVIPVYGVHGTINDADNSFASTDAPGAVERLWQEQFDSPVVVMHLQGAGADVSPTPAGGYDCGLKPGEPDDPCFSWLRAEGHARRALPILEAAWIAAGAAMQTETAIEMLTRSVELGPDPATFSVRDGALSYAPFEADRVADGEVFTAGGDVISPIDEFNAPVGAALCEEDYPIFPAGLMPGTDGIKPYGGCVRIDTAADILGQLLDIEFEVDATHPVCQTARTTVSALRIGDFLFGTIPGELSVMLADKIRATSPVGADNTVLVGYAQGHTGYCLIADDWLRAGYEPSINSWGPLEGEYLGERLSELLPLAMTAEREDGAAGGVDRFVTPTVVDSFAFDQNAMMAGTIPAPVPERVWVRGGTPVSAQPLAQVPRVSGVATFVWIGDDPVVKTPVVTLESETSPGVFAPVTRRSGRDVRDGDLLLMYTGLPVRPAAGEPQTHYWAVEWQVVPWMGAPADALTDRGSAPLGNYRFRVVGAGFDIASNPFEVVPATIGVTATRAANTISGAIRFDAPRGYRLLDIDRESNRPVPFRSGLFSVALELNAGPDLLFSDVAVAPDGVLTVDAGANAANVVGMTVTDASGNSGTDAL